MKDSASPDLQKLNTQRLRILNTVASLIDQDLINTSKAPNGPIYDLIGVVMLQVALENLNKAQRFELYALLEEDYAIDVAEFLKENIPDYEILYRQRVQEELRALTEKMYAAI